MTVENQIIYYVQKADAILVALIPWFKLLIVVGVSACAYALGEWRTRPP